MSYQALYRKWRPDRFSKVVGQTATIETLKNQVKAGHIGHAYLFSGTRGTGKTTSAKIFSRAINCQQPQDGEPCGQCESCLALAAENNMDIIEIDAASNNGVDQIREIIEKVMYPPNAGRYKVYIVDEVHMLTPQAFNALLKTLEEPPSHAVFILATTEPQRLPATILSRCQRYNFTRITVADMAQHLQTIAQAEGVTTDYEAMERIARAADGALRDAIGLLDLCFSLGQGTVTMNTVSAALGSAGRETLEAFVDALALGDAGKALQLLDERMRGGGDAAVFCREVATQIRNALVADACDDTSGILDISPQELVKLRDQARDFGTERALRALELFSRAEPEMRWASSPRTLLEMASFRACRPEADKSIEGLLERVEKLEAALKNGNFVQAAPKKEKTVPRQAGQSAQEVPLAPSEPAAPGAPPQNDGQLWKAVLKQVRTERIPIFAALQKGQFFGIRAGRADVAFAPEDSIFMAMLQRDENTRYLSDVISAQAQETIQFSLRPSGQAPEADNIDPIEAAAKKAADLFGRGDVEIIDS